MQNTVENKLENFGVPMYQGYAGSISYGTNLVTSDVDKKGIFIPHRHFLLGTRHVTEFRHKHGEDDEVWYTLQMYLKLALECNPNIMELLFLDDTHILFTDEFGKELREMREIFLTKNAYGRFGSYAFSQLKKMDNKGNHNHHGTHKVFIDEYGYDTKHAMHLIRLLQMGIEILKYHKLSTLRPNREFLLDIRHGKYTEQQIKKMAEELMAELEDAMLNSTLPDTPDFDTVNRWCISVVDRAHGKNGRGVFTGVTFNVLPAEYEMLDKGVAFTVANKLVRRHNRNEATGIVVPFKDWFTGLREYPQQAFVAANIQHIHKAVARMRACDPTILDIVFAPEKAIMYDTPHGKKLREYFKTIPSTFALQNKVPNYVRGNLKEMQHWENLKVAYTPTESKPYPDVPEDTDPKNASAMTRFGYDTLKAYELVHVAKMGIELLRTGTIADSRAWEQELYSIKHAKYKTFTEFKVYIEGLVDEFNNALPESKLPNKTDDNAIEAWLVNFIDEVLEIL